MSINICISPVTLVLLYIFAASPAIGQGPIRRSEENGVPGLKLRIDKNMVLVNASVTDQNGRFVSALNALTFQVFDEKKPVTVRVLSQEDGPISTAILLDMSSSMKKKIAHIRSGLRRFLAASIPGDDFCLITFADSVDGRCRFTADPGEINAQASRGVPQGSTALLDAMVMGLSEIKKGSNSRKALLILTDGDDTASRFTWREVEDRAKETLACLYAVVPEVWEEDRDSVDWLEGIVEHTGGRLFEVKNQREYPDFFDDLDIRRQYIIGFDPPVTGQDGKFHRVTVRLQGNKAKGAKVHWKRGYYAPTGR
jgi:Ca-activated chloride channel homolog